MIDSVAFEHISNIIMSVCKNVGFCDKCRSLGCFRSRNYVPVKDWLCYPKEYENE